jgi:hypothetical protein
MPSAEYDLRYLQAGVPVLEDYILSSDLYWPAGVSALFGEPPYPQLTLGGLMLATTRTQAHTLTATQSPQLDSLTAQIATIRSRWRTAWGKKARAEFHWRLNLWRDFLAEYRESPGENFDRYAYEVTRRVQLHLLRLDAEGIPSEEITLLDSLDRLLNAVFQPGEFIWEPELSSGFPTQAFWYLYGKVKK